MFVKPLFIVFGIFISDYVYAQADFLSHFLTGKYLLVGEALNSSDTYSGRVEFYIENDSLKVKRSINNSNIFGTAEIDSTLSVDNAKVLRIHFIEQGKEYEQTCLWQSDLDNYARISCYLYESGKSTADPGLEVLFHDHTSN